MTISFLESYAKSTYGKTFAVLNNILYIDDSNVVDLYRNVALVKENPLLWKAVMKNIYGDAVDFENYKLDDELEEFYKFIQNDVTGFLSHNSIDFEDIEIYQYKSGRSIYALSMLIAKGIIRKDQAREILKLVLSPNNIGRDLEDILMFSTLLDDADVAGLEAIVKSVLANSAKAIEEIKGGKDKAIGSIVGQVMKQMKADPKLVNDTIRRMISEM